MRTRKAPIYQALGGLSLALACSPLGLGQWSLALLEPAAETAAGPSESTAERASAPVASRDTAQSLAGEPCGSCQTLIAGIGLFEDMGEAPSLAVSASALDMNAPSPGRATRLAAARASSRALSGGSGTREGPEPALAALPAGHGYPGIEPAVEALFEPTAVEPIVIAAAPEAEPDTVEPSAGTPAHPLSAQPTPEGLYEPAPAGAPVKRSGGRTPEKPDGQPDAPLPWNPPADNLPERNPFPPSEPPDDPSVILPPWITPVPDGPGPSGPVTPWPPEEFPPLLPLQDPSAPNKVATGDPPTTPDDVRGPQLHPAAQTDDLLVAAAVPEPASLALFAIAAFSLAAVRRRATRR